VTNSKLDNLYLRLNQANIPSLDGLRAVAVTEVIVYHLGIPGSPGGSHGVMAFFVLSGFLITWLLLSEEEKFGNISLSSFYKRRVLRIFPAFYCMWFVSVVLLLIERKTISWGAFFSCFFYVGNYWFGITNRGDQVMGMAWSLGVEEQFYIFWPLCFILFRHNLKRLTQVLLGIIFVAWFYRVFLCFYVHPPHNYLEYAFDTRMDSLMVGCLTAILLKRRVLDRLLNVIAQNPLLPFFTLILLGIVVSLGSFVQFDYRHTVTFALEPFLVAILLIQLVQFGFTAPWSWLNWLPIRFVGRISYPLYLYHLLAINQTEFLLPNLRLRWQYPVMISLSFLFAVCSYFLVEKPFLALKSRFAPEMRPLRQSLSSHMQTQLPIAKGVSGHG
jgi:peptidoglycan/LPS O-acetylase OafA/YrhL